MRNTPVFQGICVAVLAGLLVAPHVLAASSLQISFPLARSEWVAARFNLTGSGDLTASLLSHNCPVGEGRLADAGYVIIDGKPSWTHLALEGVRFTSDSSFAHAQVATIRASAPMTVFDPSCSVSYSWFDPTFVSPASPPGQVTLLTAIGAGAGRTWLNATWDPGAVASYDIATGTATMTHSDEWGTGVGAGEYVQPVAAGALQTTTQHTLHDTIGWFLPHSANAAPASKWACTQNGDACPPLSVLGASHFVGKGATTWHVETTYLETDNPPMNLALIELPADDYVTAPFATG